MAKIVFIKDNFTMVNGAAAGDMENVLGEKCFNLVLCRERKRTERSGESMLLLLFDLTQIADMRERARVFKVVAEPLSRCIRETDVCGWLRDPELFGIIFTDIARHNVAQAKQTVESKASGLIRAKLPQSVYQKLRLSILAYPEEHDGIKQGEEFNPLLYPEISRHDPADRVKEICKRLMDVVGSCVALLLFSPLFLVIALLIKLTSPGPVIFRQERIGRYGKPFTFLKFRSMHVDSNDALHREYVRKLIANKIDGDPSSGNDRKVFKIRDDPRIMPIGNFLRKSSLDELPQFLNVLKGDMSLVGPRPPIPYEVADYAPWHRYRIFAGKPGITGLWQVKGRSMTTFDDMVRLDLQYGRTWSLWLDIKLILATPMAVLRGKGAY